MAERVSAGLMMYRRGPSGLEVFLVHPGGPYFARKDLGVWTVPKGEPNAGEELLACARREFEEETGMRPESERFLPLGEIQQKGGKRVTAWAFEGDFGARELRCNEFELEWPPRSGRKRRFPEVDRGEHFALEDARAKLNPAQVPLLERLIALVGEKS
jgi:predicted NUDIX family NTP pyrophosphohydrolase